MKNRSVRHWVLRAAIFIAAILVSPEQAQAATPPAPEHLSHEQLIDDIRDFSELLEQTHPDPYIQGGGKVAYHRRLQRLMRSMP